MKHQKNQHLHPSKWLPTTMKEVKQRGWDSLDVILFSGDAYVDHPSFGGSVVGRILESYGLKVAIVPQPNWRDDLRDFKKMGTPNLFFAISAGCMDSMVNHYTANKRRRSDDAYTPDANNDMRPDYATLTYAKIIKSFFPDTPLVIGGIEASLRRVTHYDYWSDQLKPSILHESNADMLIYGMGELPLRQIVQELQAGKSFDQLDSIPQTAIRRSKGFVSPLQEEHSIHLASHETCLKSKEAFATNFKHIELESNAIQAELFTQEVGDEKIIINPPFEPMSEAEADHFAGLPFTRLPHPKYKGKRIPAYEMIRHSVNMHRGCFGGCSFCTISAHQGKQIVSRSKASIINEVKAISEMPDFKGYISDLGGPSANMYKMKGEDMEQCRKCKRPSCIFPKLCSNLNLDYKPIMSVYKEVRQMPGIKKAFVGSGIRYDMIFAKGQDINDHPDREEYLRTVIRNHVSGRLKVAPEHTSDPVLKMMRKSSFTMFHELNEIFIDENKRAGLNQQLIPYFISSHPGSTPKDMANLMMETRKLDFKLEQVQDFTPTPMTLATVMFYTGLDPYTLKPVYSAKSKDEKLSQRKFFFWYKNEYRKEVERDLTKMGYADEWDEMKNSTTGRQSGDDKQRKSSKKNKYPRNKK